MWNTLRCGRFSCLPLCHRCALSDLILWPNLVQSLHYFLISNRYGLLFFLPFFLSLWPTLFLHTYTDVHFPTNNYSITIALISRQDLELPVVKLNSVVALPQRSGSRVCLWWHGCWNYRPDCPSVLQAHFVLKIQMPIALVTGTNQVQTKINIIQKNKKLNPNPLRRVED